MQKITKHFTQQVINPNAIISAKWEKLLPAIKSAMGIEGLNVVAIDLTETGVVVHAVNRPICLLEEKVSTRKMVGDPDLVIDKTY